MALRATGGACLSDFVTASSPVRLLCDTRYRASGSRVWHSPRRSYHLQFSASPQRWTPNVACEAPQRPSPTSTGVPQCNPPTRSAAQSEVQASMALSGVGGSSTDGTETVHGVQIYQRPARRSIACPSGCHPVVIGSRCRTGHCCPRTRSPLVAEGSALRHNHWQDYMLRSYTVTAVCDKTALTQCGLEWQVHMLGDALAPGRVCLKGHHGGLAPSRPSFAAQSREAPSYTYPFPRES